MLLPYEMPCAECGALTRRACADRSHHGQPTARRVVCRDHRKAVSRDGRAPFWLCEVCYNAQAADPVRYGPLILVEDPGN
jgi:hypothetical protein